MHAAEAGQISRSHPPTEAVPCAADPNLTTISSINKMHPREDVIISGSSRSLYAWRPKPDGMCWLSSCLHSCMHSASSALLALLLTHLGQVPAHAVMMYAACMGLYGQLPLMESA